MPINELTEKPIIILPRSLDSEEAEKLLYYLAEKLPGTVVYHISCNKTISHSREDNKKIVTEDGKVDIDGVISSLKNPIAFNFFHLRPVLYENTSKLSVISFRIDDLGLPEYRTGAKKVRDQMRKLVCKYSDSS